jgi:signal transduction histidine kinase
MEPENSSLSKTFRNLECLTIVLAAATQLGWVLNVIQFHWLVGVSFFLLAVCLFLSIMISPKSSRGNLYHILAQATIISLACGLGPPRRYTAYFLVLAAKSAAFLPRTQMLFAIAALLVARIFAGTLSIYTKQHVYIHRLAQDRFYTSVIVETESKLYFLIGLVAVLFLGRLVASERRSRKAQKLLANEAKEMAIELERNKIASDIHERMGHTLASLIIQIELAIKLVEENQLDQAKEPATKSYNSAVRCLREIREAVTAIRNREAPVQPSSGA